MSSTLAPPLPVRPAATASRRRSGAAPELAVVLPARDEANGIAALLAEIAAALDTSFVHEIIVVDDGSRDGTLDVLLRLREERHPNLRVIRHARSVGQSFALLSAVRAARAPLIVTLDADGQNVPGDIPALVALAQTRVPGTHFCVAGHRVRRRDTRWKRWQSRVANAVRARLLGDATPDTGCGLKVMPTATWLALPAFDHMHRFLPALVQRIGGTVIVQEVRHRERRQDRSKYGMWDRLLPGLVDLAGVIWLGWRMRAVEAVELSPTRVDAESNVRR